MNRHFPLSALKTARLVDKDEMLVKLCTGKTVLDVGCLGQDRKYLSEDWLHNKLRGVARYICGVDIVKDKIIELNRIGYNIVHLDDLIDTQSKYEVIVLSDVIEHVRNGSDFLELMISKITDDGIIIITTPNAKRSLDFINIIITGKYYINLEHTMWFCPLTLSELVGRNQLEIVEFYWIKRCIPQGVKYNIVQKSILWFADFLTFFRPAFHENFMFVVKKRFI